MDPAIVRVDGQTGAILDRVTLPPAIPADSCISVSTSLSPDGSLLLRLAAMYWRPCAHPPEGIWRRPETLARFDPVTGVIDTLGVMPGTELKGSRQIQFARGLEFGQTVDRLFVGDTGADSIVVMRLDGTRLRVLHTGLESAIVPQEVIEKLASSRFPREASDRYPGFTRILPDRHGNVWVMAYPVREGNNGASAGGAIEGYDWVVLGPDGGRVAEVRTSPALTILEIGEDYLIDVVSENMGIESIRLYTFRKHE